MLSNQVNKQKEEKKSTRMIQTIFRVVSIPVKQIELLSSRVKTDRGWTDREIDTGRGTTDRERDRQTRIDTTNKGVN